MKSTYINADTQPSIRATIKQEVWIKAQQSFSFSLSFFRFKAAVRDLKTKTLCFIALSPHLVACSAFSKSSFLDSTDWLAYAATDLGFFRKAIYKHKGCNISSYVQCFVPYHGIISQVS